VLVHLFAETALVAAVAAAVEEGRNPPASAVGQAWLPVEVVRLRDYTLWSVEQVQNLELASTGAGAGAGA
jgi:hypothetical protein